MDWNQGEWDGCGGPLDDAVVKRAEALFGVTLPEDYKSCIRVCHGGRPRSNGFAFHDPDIGRMESCVGLLLSFSPTDSESIFSTFDRLKPFLPVGAIPIADDGGGDFVCLDYGQGTVPTIGYWHHGSEALVPLARTFTAFIASLYRDSTSSSRRARVPN